jgi:hypothetical protein
LFLPVGRLNRPELRLLVSAGRHGRRRSDAMIDSTTTVEHRTGTGTTWLDPSLADGVRTVALIGTGSGRALDVLLARRPGLRIVAFEPDAAIARTLTARLVARGAADGVAVTAGPAYAGAADIARQFPELHRALLLVDPALGADSDAASSAREAFARVTFQTSANEGARRASAGRYLLHTLSNAPRIARESDVRALEGLATGMPAIIAAAGPSLDANVHDLSPVRDRAILISCDTAARPLLSLGIEPDFIVGADPSRANAAHLASLPASAAWLVAEGSLHPSALTPFEHRTFFFNVSPHHPWPWLASVGLDRMTLATWGSVATSCFSLAMLMGCDPIVFIGADFAFTGGRPYCRGTSFEPQWATWIAGGAEYPAIWQTLVDRWPMTTAPDLHGRPARTARHLVSFRDWIVERAAASGRRVVNATGEGLLAGNDIAQATVSGTLGASAPIPRELLHKTIRAAHTSARGDLARLLTGVDDVIDSSGGATRDAWTLATDNTVSPAAIRSALRSSEHLAWSLARGSASTKEQL